MSLPERQAPIDRRIVHALVAATPETWNAIHMVVDRREEGAHEKIGIEISSPEGRADVIVPTEELYAALYALSDCYRSEAKMWSGATYSLELRADGDWKFRVQFTY